MKTVYGEIRKGRGCVSVDWYTERQYAAVVARRRKYVTRRRRLNHIRESIGGVIGVLGFFFLAAVGGAEDLTVITVGGLIGLGMMVLGAWLGHAFYGQEQEAEWLRRQRERDNGV